jgi:tetratricopeptide (TPR) repeat protein
MTKQIILNPYDILGVSQAASKAEILSAKIAAMKAKKYPLNIIAEAEKKLLKHQERILADYLMPILPKVKRFKTSDLSALSIPIPVLDFLADFDDLDRALMEALAAEKLAQATLSSCYDSLFSGIELAKNGQYVEAIKILLDFSKNCFDLQSKEYLQGQMWLVKSYQEMGEIDRAIAICQNLINSENPSAQNWAKTVLNSLNSLRVNKPKVTLEMAIETMNKGDYFQAINILLEFIKNCQDQGAKEYLQAQMYLVKAYHSAQQRDQAIALCKKLAQSDNIQVQTWANQALKRGF